MKKVIVLIICSAFLFSEMDFEFPDAFIQDNNLVYDKSDVIRVVPKKVKKVQQKPNMLTNQDINRTIQLFQSMNKKPQHMTSNTSASIYLAPLVKKRTNLYLVGLGVGFLINDWINTEFLAGKSLQNTKSSMYDIANEYSFNILNTEFIRANIIADLSVGGLFNKETSSEKHFYAYGGGGEIELVLKKVKISGSYKSERVKLDGDKVVTLKVYAVKFKFNFPL